MQQKIITILNFTIGKVFIFDVTKCQNDDEDTLCTFLDQEYNYDLDFAGVEYMITEGLSLVIDI